MATNTQTHEWSGRRGGSLEGLGGRRVLKQTTVSIRRQFSVVWKFDEPAGSLVPKFIFYFWSTGVFRISKADNVALSHMYRGWWASFLATFWTTGTYFYVFDVDTATIRTIGRGVEYVDNHQNYRSKSGICCRVQTSVLLVGGCCFFSVHVPTSFCCCELQPVVLRDEK